MRRIVAFRCEGAQLFGTLDAAAGTTGVLIVSGGNEIRCGAHRGMALLAGRLAAAGIPVFRFDRRGVGDSEGDNGGYASSAPDIAAALSAFRERQPHVAHVVGFGNCDAATALVLFDRGCDALVLGNPWLGDERAPPPPAALRAHYRRRLADPVAWRTLMTRNPLLLLRHLRGVLGRTTEQPLAESVGIALACRRTTILLASGDRTAQVFGAAFPRLGGVHLVRVDTASHSFAEHRDALVDAIADVVAALNGKSVA